MSSLNQAENGRKEGFKVTKVWMAISFLSFIVGMVVQSWISSNVLISRQLREETMTNNVEVESTTNSTFEDVYKHKRWTSEGGGSGEGSTHDNGRSAGYILRIIMKQYNLTKLLDAPCGASGVSWMRPTFTTLRSVIPNFQYHGVDVVGSVIDKNKADTASLLSYVKYSRLDLSAKDAKLPSGYDIILSRDSLQHLSMPLIASAFITYCRSDVRYFLAGSYLQRWDSNRDIEVGGYFNLNLLAKPFDFDDMPIEAYSESNQCTRRGALPTKTLLLFDLPMLCKTKQMLAFQERFAPKYINLNATT